MQDEVVYLLFWMYESRQGKGDKLEEESGKSFIL